MRRALAALALAGAAVLPAQAASLAFCSRPLEPSAAQHDRLLRFGAELRRLLEQSGSAAALVARSGTNLHWIGQRYSHAGLSLRDSGQSRWSVRQLYYACDEGRSRLFDQGLPAFLLDFADPDEGYVTLLLPPPEAGTALAGTALDDATALALLEPRYNAGGYPFSLRDQNCNQWVAELLAAAWAPQRANTRAAAQRWLADSGYRPEQVATGALQGLAPFIPWVDGQDQPRETLAQGIWQVSLPGSLVAYAQRLWPDTRRIELCHDRQRIVVREGGPPIAAGCQPAEGDRVIALD